MPFAITVGNRADPFEPWACVGQKAILQLLLDGEADAVPTSIGLRDALNCAIKDRQNELSTCFPLISIERGI